MLRQSSPAEVCRLRNCARDPRPTLFACDTLSRTTSPAEDFHASHRSLRHPSLHRPHRARRGARARRRDRGGRSGRPASLGVPRGAGARLRPRGDHAGLHRPAHPSRVLGDARARRRPALRALEAAGHGARAAIRPRRLARQRTARRARGAAVRHHDDRRHHRLRGIRGRGVGGRTSRVCVSRGLDDGQGRRRRRHGARGLTTSNRGRQAGTIA